MKIKTILTLCFMTMVSMTASAQTVNDIFDPAVPVTWLGIDFTGALFIGDREKFGSESDIRSLLARWNDLMESEKSKFEVDLMIGKNKVDFNLGITKDHNAELDVSTFLTEKSADHRHLRKDDIQTIVSSYDFEKLSGLGLMFNVESFNKINGEALIWVTFINLATKEILVTEQLSAPPGGAGIRNYWAGAIYDVMIKVKKKEFEIWRKKYQRN